MAEQTTSQNGLAGAISSAIAPVLSQAQTGLVEDVNDAFGGEGSIAPTPAPTPSAPAAPSLSTPQPTVQPGFQPNMPIVPNRGGTGDPQILMRLLRNQEQMREQMNAMNRFGQSPFARPIGGAGSPFPRPIGGVFGGTRLQPVSDVPEPQSGPEYPTQMLAAGGKTEAKAVQNQGRGNDTMLVHMTPGEVAGLQALAMQHGGSLTINPETGLAEAGFLKSILPTLIGAGLMMVPGMQGIGAGYIGAGVGALEFARTGDLGKGLMAGLGAYGGAGLASSALAAGAATGQAGATIPAGELAKSQAISSAPMSVPPQFTPPETFMGNLSQAGSGVSNIFNSGATGQVARDAAMQGFQDTGVEYAGLGSGTGLAMKGAAAFAEPLSQPAPMPTIAQPEYNYKGPYKPTKREVVYPGEDRDPNDSSEFLYFPNTNPVPYAEGGTSVATAPPEGYVPGQDGEFVYGFTPMSTDMPIVQETARASRGIDAIAPAPDTIRIASTRVSGGDGGDDNTGGGTSFNTGRPNDYEAEAYNVGTSTREKEQQGRAAAAAAIAAENAGMKPDYAMGGEVNMHNNGFVVDAHTVSEVGNGSSNAGIEQFMGIGGRPITGPGDGTSDSIPANIDGIQPAMVARDEVYMSPPAVAAYGGGSLKVGEKKLYKLMEKAHASRKKNGRGQSTGLQQLVS